MIKIFIYVVVGISILLSFLPGPAEAADPADPDRQPDIGAVTSFLRDIDKPVDYMELSRSISLLGPGSKDMLIEVLKREKPVEVMERYGLPGVMSPLDVLKATALDALGRLGDYECVDEMKEVHKKADNNTLRRIARKNIEALGGSVDE
jgi:hypothetical protein